MLSQPDRARPLRRRARLGFYTLAGLSERRGPVVDPGVPPRRGPITQVVILGGGFAGVSTAQRLEQLLRRRRDIHVVLVSQSNYLLFTPMLAEVAGGELEAQHIGVPLRAALPHTEVRRTEVLSIQTRGQIVGIRVDGTSALVSMREIRCPFPVTPTCSDRPDQPGRYCRASVVR
jgi:hypothetical protein